MPAPPRGVPAAADGDGDHHLAEEGRGHRHRQQQRRRPATVELQVADDGPARTARRRRGPERRRGRRSCSGAAGSSSGGSCRRDSAAQAPAGPARRPGSTPARRTTAAARAGRHRHRGGGQEGAGDHQADPRGQREPRIGPVQQHARGRQGVQSQEPGGGQEGHRHEEDPGVGPAMGGDAHGVGDTGVDDAGHQHQPEMGALMLPAVVQVGFGHQQDQSQDRQRHQPDQGQRLSGRAERPARAARLNPSLSTWATRSSRHPRFCSPCHPMILLISRRP